MLSTEAAQRWWTGTVPAPAPRSVRHTPGELRLSTAGGPCDGGVSPGEPQGPLPPGEVETVRPRPRDMAQAASHHISGRGGLEGPRHPSTRAPEPWLCVWLLPTPRQSHPTPRCWHPLSPSPHGSPAATASRLPREGVLRRKAPLPPGWELPRKQKFAQLPRNPQPGSRRGEAHRAWGRSHGRGFGNPQHTCWGLDGTARGSFWAWGHQVAGE